MALTKCKECGHDISESAEFCRNCGAKVKRTSRLVVVVLAFVALAIYLVHWAGESARTQKTSEEAVRWQAEQVQLASMTPEQRAEAEKKREEQERARREAELRRLGLKWDYQDSEDEMGRGKIKTALVNSLNQIEFDFPYKRPQRATLRLRRHPKYGRDVILQIERGQFLCGIGGCNVQVRFGSKKPVAFSASEPADHRTTALFINNHDSFVASTRKVEKVYIEAQFFREGNRVFEFDVSSLKWP
jgi:zinc-ribbon domain